MLPSLCRLMASIPYVSYCRSLVPVSGSLREPSGGGTGAGSEADLASVPLAGSIGTRFVARLYSEGSLRCGRHAAPSADRRQAPGGWRDWQRGSGKEPPVAGACTAGEVLS